METFSFKQRKNPSALRNSESWMHLLYDINALIVLHGPLV